MPDIREVLTEEEIAQISQALYVAANYGTHYAMAHRMWMEKTHPYVGMCRCLISNLPQHATHTKLTCPLHGVEP